MPMPHRTFAAMAKRRLIGKEGTARTREIRELLGELPDYRNGPYADLRKWLTEEIDETDDLLTLTGLRLLHERNA